VSSEKKHDCPAIALGPGNCLNQMAKITGGEDVREAGKKG
jgi:hypothetical protein